MSDTSKCSGEKWGRLRGVGGDAVDMGLLLFIGWTGKVSMKRWQLSKGLKGNKGVRLGVVYVKGFSGEEKAITKALRSNYMLDVLEEEPGGQWVRRWVWQMRSERWRWPTGLIGHCKAFLPRARWEVTRRVWVESDRSRLPFQKQHCGHCVGNTLWEGGQGKKQQDYLGACCLHPGKRCSGLGHGVSEGGEKWLDSRNTLKGLLRN